MTFAYCSHELVDVLVDVFRQVRVSVPRAVAQRRYGNSKGVEEVDVVKIVVHFVSPYTFTVQQCIKP